MGQYNENSPLLEQEMIWRIQLCGSELPIQFLVF